MPKCINSLILRFIFLASLFLQGIFLWASPLFFTNLTIDNGLGSNVTNSIVQDNYGFIWIGTQEGLCRYDGYKMIQFQNNNTPGSISSNNISSLLNDGDDIWVGTWDGLCKINVRTFKVTRINTGQNKVIRTLLKDKKKNIWIGTSNGLLVYYKNNGEFVYYNSANSALSHNTIRSFYESSNGDIWIGTYNGINRFRQGELSAFNVKGNYKPFLQNNLICSIIPFDEKSDSLLWVGTETGLALFNTTNGNYKLWNVANTNLSNEVVKCIYRQNDSLLWLGTDFGLNIFNTETHTTTHYYHDPLINNTVASNVIWEIFEDSEQRLWLITSGGVSIVDNSRQYHRMHEEYFSFNNPRIGNQIKDIIVDRLGNIWMATIHGVICKNPVTGQRTAYSTTSPVNQRILLDNVYALEEDNQGRIWIGTAGGINIWNPFTRQMLAITANKQNGLLSNYISGFAKQDDGTFWVSAWEGGLFKVQWDGNYPESMKFILVDRDGDGRFITLGNQVFYGSRNSFWQINGQRLQKNAIVAVNKVLGNSDITGMVAGSNGQIWIGSENLLIGYYPATDSLLKIAINIGRPQKLINLVEDQAGNVWATSRNSILKINTHNYQYYTVPVNINSPLKGFYHYCNARLPDGKVLFGGDNGYIEVDPSQMIVSDKGPKVLLSGLFVNNQPVIPSDSSAIMKNDIAFAENLKLKHHQSSITFEFSTLDFLFPHESQFSYRLLPLQDVWQSTSGIKNFAVFSNLKPGEYWFEVKGTNHLGIWSDVRSVEIRISPPIWLSKGFLVMYFFVLVSLTYFIFRIYSYRQRLRNELNIVKLENQHKESLYQAKIQFFTNISHEFRTPLSLILPPIQELLKKPVPDAAYEKMLRLAGRNAQRLYKLVNQLLDFRKIEASGLELNLNTLNIVPFCHDVFTSFDDMAARHEIAYSFTSAESEIFIEIDGEKIEAIVFNLLSNAFKYSPYGGSINLEIKTIRFDDNNQAVTISIKDSGIGISGEDLPFIFEQFYQTPQSKSLKVGSGIGLTLAMEYAKLHNGTILVDSEPNKGSTFTLQIPITKQREISESIHQNNLQTVQEHYKNVVTPNLSTSAKRLLFIDDNDDILEFIELNMKAMYQVYCAKNGKEGLELFDKIRPHVVISDIMMPVMDGFEVCEHIKGNKITAHIPVILLTAKSLDMQMAEGMNKGADMYITKPFDIEYLKSCIQGLLRRDEQLAGHIRKEILINPVSNTNTTPNADDLFVGKVMAIIENNLSNPSLSVDMIGAEMGMSSTHLYRKLKEITGHSTKEIILNYRMKKAADMIENNEGNVTEVMYAVGFSSLSSFSKSFKTRFGVSPSDYKVGGRSEHTQ